MDIAQLLSDPIPDHIVISPPTLPSPRHHQPPPPRHRSRSSPSATTSKSKRRVCDKCGHSFVSKAHLGIHDRTVHQRLKPYQCDICKTGFGQPGTLTRHKAAVHEKRRDHECVYAGCKKRFGSRWTLSVHEVCLLYPFSLVHLLRS